MVYQWLTCLHEVSYHETTVNGLCYCHTHTGHIKTRTDMCHSNLDVTLNYWILVTIFLCSVFPVSFNREKGRTAKHWEKRTWSLTHDRSFIILCYLFPCSAKCGRCWGEGEIQILSYFFTTGSFTGTRQAVHNLFSTVIVFQASLLFVIH